MARFTAAQKYDRGENCGAEANAAKYLAGEAAFKACTNAIQTHGGIGYAKEFHVERYFRRCSDDPPDRPGKPANDLELSCGEVLELPRSY